MISFRGAHFVKDVILTCVQWYLAYPLSHRQVEELMQERGVSVDPATIQRWVLKYSAPLEAAFHRRKCPIQTLAPDLHALEPTLTCYGYNVRPLAELLNIRQAEVRA